MWPHAGARRVDAVAGGAAAENLLAMRSIAFGESAGRREEDERDRGRDFFDRGHHTLDNTTPSASDNEEGVFCHAT